MSKNPRKYGQNLSRDALITELEGRLNQLESQNNELTRTVKKKEISLKKYTGHYDLAPVGYLSLDAKGLILEVNLTGCRLLGVEREKLIGKPVRDYIDPLYKDKIQNHIKRVFRSKTGDVCQVKVNYEQEPFYVELRSIAVKDEETGQRCCRSSMFNITGKMKVEAELKEQRKLIEAVFEHIESSILVCNQEGKLTLLNRPAINLFGSDLLGLESHKWAEYLSLYHEDGVMLLDMHEIPLYKALQGQRIENMEVNVITRQGERRTLLASGQPITRPPDIKIGAMIALQDITDRKKAEIELNAHQQQLENLVEGRTAELKRTNDKLSEEIKERIRLQKRLLVEKDFAESLINSQPGLFYLLDKQGKMIRWNKNMELYSGYSREEIKNMEVLKLVVEDDVAATKEKLNEVFQRGKAVGKARFRSKGGKVMTFLLTGVALNIEGVDYVIGTGIDITAKEKERARRMQFFQILEKSKNEIYMFDVNTFKLIYVNAGARKNLGYTSEELKNMRAFELSPDMTEDSLKEIIQPLISKEVEKISFQTVKKRSDGSVYDVEDNFQLIEQGNQSVIVAIAWDITDRLKVEEELKHSLKEKELLLGEIHHRVKNNLSIISSLLIMQASYQEDKVVHDLFKESESRIKSMGMIHEMLYQQESFSQIDFGPYIKKLIEHIAFNFKSGDVSIKTRVKVEDVLLEINTAIPCALIINELLTNAYKHAFKGREKGMISVSLFHEDSTVKLIVKDNGIGLPEVIEGTKLYETLGMSLISGLIAQLNGELDIKRKNGTTFTIVFPKLDKDIL